MRTTASLTDHRSLAGPPTLPARWVVSIDVEDVSVRPARADDVAEIARIQLQTWQSAYQAILPTEVLSSLTEQQLAQGWRQAITAPPSRAHRVLVASEGDFRVGFAAFGPDADEQPGDPEPAATAAITALLVEPRWGRRGHGSRLVAAVADTAADLGVSRLVAWVAAADSVSLQFYRAAGWEADGLQRSLDTGAGLVSELRLHTSLMPS